MLLYVAIGRDMALSHLSRFLGTSVSTLRDTLPPAVTVRLPDWQLCFGYGIAHKLSPNQPHGAVVSLCVLTPRTDADTKESTPPAEGVIWELPSSALDALDAAHGHLFVTQRTTILLPDGREAIVYMAASDAKRGEGSRRDSLVSSALPKFIFGLPHRGHIRALVRAAQEAQLSTSYIQWLTEWPVLEQDPDSACVSFAEVCATLLVSSTSATDVADALWMACIASQQHKNKRIPKFEMAKAVQTLTALADPSQKTPWRVLASLVTHTITPALRASATPQRQQQHQQQQQPQPQQQQWQQQQQHAQPQEQNSERSESPALMILDSDSEADAQLDSDGYEMMEEDNDDNENNSVAHISEVEGDTIDIEQELEFIDEELNNEHITSDTEMETIERTRDDGQNVCYSRTWNERSSVSITGAVSASANGYVAGGSEDEADQFKVYTVQSEFELYEHHNTYSDQESVTHITEVNDDDVIEVELQSKLSDKQSKNDQIDCEREDPHVVMSRAVANLGSFASETLASVRSVFVCDSLRPDLFDFLPTNAPSFQTARLVRALTSDFELATLPDAQIVHESGVGRGAVAFVLASKTSTSTTDPSSSITTYHNTSTPAYPNTYTSSFVSGSDSASAHSPFTANFTSTHAASSSPALVASPKSVAGATSHTYPSGSGYAYASSPVAAQTKTQRFASTSAFGTEGQVPPTSSSFSSSSSGSVPPNTHQHIPASTPLSPTGCTGCVLRASTCEQLGILLSIVGTFYADTPNVYRTVVNVHMQAGYSELCFVYVHKDPAHHFSRVLVDDWATSVSDSKELGVDHLRPRFPGVETDLSMSNFVCVMCAHSDPYFRNVCSQCGGSLGGSMDEQESRREYVLDSVVSEAETLTFEKQETPRLLCDSIDYEMSSDVIDIVEEQSEDEHSIGVFTSSYSESFVQIHSMDASTNDNYATDRLRADRLSSSPKPPSVLPSFNKRTTAVNAGSGFQMMLRHDNVAATTPSQRAYKERPDRLRVLMALLHSAVPLYVSTSDDQMEHANDNNNNNDNKMNNNIDNDNGNNENNDNAHQDLNKKSLNNNSNNIEPSSSNETQVLHNRFNLVSVINSPIERRHLLPVHASEHIDRVHNHTTNVTPGTSGDKEWWRDTYWCTYTYEAALVAAGAVVRVVDAVMSGQAENGFAVVRPPGHHADKDACMGFCVFNNVAVAARYAQREQGAKRILIFDWDVHHGNGTQSIFEDDPSVLYISIHRLGFYPYTGHPRQSGTGKGEGYSVNVGWPADTTGFGDASYMRVMQRIVLPIAQNFNPDLILISAGFDAAKGDFAKCCLTPKGYADMLHSLMRQVCERVVLVLEGGYHLGALANSMLACLHVLSGGDAEDVSTVVDGHVEAREGCGEPERYMLVSDEDRAIDETVRTLSPFWECLLDGDYTQYR